MNLVFVVGTGRCGSTLIHEILCKHESFGFVSNVEDNLPFISLHGRWNNSLYRTALGNFTRKGRLRFAPSEAYKLISREVSPIYANSCRDLTADDVTPWLERRFRQFFEIRDQVQAKSVFSHKYTGWPRLGFFQNIFPQAKFIHIVRDGRAVANSWLQMPWWGGYRGPENWLWGELDPLFREEWLASEKSFAVLAAMGWKVLMASFEQAETNLDNSNYLRLRYEDILAEPRLSFDRMLTFCGLEWTPAFDRQFRQQKFFTDRKAAYTRDLTTLQLNEIEVCLGEYLARYGYV